MSVHYRDYILLLDSHTCQPLQSCATSLLPFAGFSSLDQLQFSPTDTNMLVSCHSDVVLIWNVHEGTKTVLPKINELYLSTSTLHAWVGPDDRLYLWSSRDQAVYCVDIASQKILWRASGNYWNNVKLIFHNGVIFVVGSDTVPVVLDANTGVELYRLVEHKTPIIDAFVQIQYKTGMLYRKYGAESFLNDLS